MTTGIGGTDGRGAAQAAGARAQLYLRLGVGWLVVAVVWLSTKPFMQAPPADGAAQGGDIVNQLTFSSLAVLSAASLLFVDRRALLPLLNPFYVLLGLWLVVGVATSTQVDVSLRAFLFTAIVMFLAAATLVLPPNPGRFAAIVGSAAALVLALCFLGVLLLPGQAVHMDVDPFEPEHAGSWRGLFDHKNIAGAMMGVLMFIGIGLFRSGRRALGVLIAAGAAVFLWFTNSKTSLALAPAVAAVVATAVFVKPLALRFVVLIGPILALLLATLGSVLFRPVGDLVQFVVPGTTFTGRVDIWKYGFEKLVERPLTGFGFESFWLTPITLFGESKQELAWNVDRIVHGHNGYLDVALTLGLPGLAIVVVAFVLMPVLDYHKAKTRDPGQPLIDMFLMIWLFVMLNMALESYFFRRADPVWFALLLAVFGLRLSAGHGVARAPLRDPRPS
jgi:O-antigen ligase